MKTRSNPFNVSNCRNESMWVDELVHWLFSTVRPERYVITRYVFMYIYWFIFISILRNTVQSVWGTDGRVGQLYGEEKTETVCWLCDKYGNLARNCGL